MPELEDIIGSVMSSPESMEKIMDIVKIFGAGDDGEANNEREERKEKNPLPISDAGLSGIDPVMISKIMELLSEYNADGDRRINLLSAIRPFLRSEDGFHIDRAIRIVKLSHVAKSLFENFLKSG